MGIKKTVKLDQDTKAKLNWLVNRIVGKTKFPRETVEEVLGQISDLSWDWQNSEYDLHGLEIEELLFKLGETRDPSNVSTSPRSRTGSNSRVSGLG